MSSQSSFSIPDNGRILIRNRFGTVMSSESECWLTIALSVQADEYPQRFSWAKDNAFALEYTPDPLHPELIPVHIKPFIKVGIPVRFHCRFPDYEIGNTNPAEAEKAVQTHLKVINAMEGIGEPVVTIHLNLAYSRITFDPDRGVENLTRLVEGARQVGITVCLENLRRGPTSDPNNILAWADASGAMITLDIGHAISSEYLKNSNTTVPHIINLFQKKLYEVHMYAKEEDRHYPIENIDTMKPVIDSLLTTDCFWWTIELDMFDEALDTRRRLLTYLKERNYI